MSDIESRRFTAVLDAMEERIDPEKIERMRIANVMYRTENEPVLMRDILRMLDPCFWLKSKGV